MENCALILADTAPPRLHALDAIRAAALLLGIALHACLSFLPGIDPGLWPISDSQKSETLSVTMFVIHVFRMSVFFLVAGLFTRVLFHRDGLAAFCRNRRARILAPLVLGWVVSGVLAAAAVLWALARANGNQLPDPLPRFITEASPNFLHLWFLYLLLWLYVLALSARSALDALGFKDKVGGFADAALRAAVTAPLGAVLLALPVAAALSQLENWNAWMGIPPPGYTLVPPAIPTFIYAYVFLIGWLLDRQRVLLEALGDRCWVNFGLGLVGALACIQLTGVDAAAVLHGGTIQLAYAAAYGIALVCWTFAFVGAGVKYLHRESALIRYGADASYWMYIMHLPLVMALQAAFMLADLHWAIKFALINGICFSTLWVTYHWGVRSTWIGLLLNGKRHERGLGVSSRA
ncbi:MAG: hypothetical protein RLZZ618_640 [Pseudomonadota bacterium]|jgi:hypothetical protein